MKKLLGKILMIIALVYLICALLVYFKIVAVANLSFLTLGGALQFGSWVGFAVVGAVIGILAFVISPEGAGQVLERISAGATALAQGIGKVGTGILGGLVTGLVAGASGSGIGGLVIMGVGGYLLYKWLTKPESPTAVNDSSQVRKIERTTEVKVENEGDKNVQSEW